MTSVDLCAAMTGLLGALIHQHGSPSEPLLLLLLLLLHSLPHTLVPRLSGRSGIGHYG